MVHKIVMPDLGQTTAEGRILRWLKNPGEKVTKGDFLLEVETDKVTMEVESYVGGYLRQVLATEGQMVSAACPIALITDTLEEPLERSEEKAPPSSPAFQPKSTPSRIAIPSPTGSPVAPAARALARELGIDMALVSGTGPGGLITRKDVETFSRNRASLKAMDATKSGALE
jgi:pyruvate dehydrogenase E2 component (dihydrolipoamide acetyltransferase)